MSDDLASRHAPLAAALADRYRIERELDVLPGASTFVVLAHAERDRTRVVVTLNYPAELRGMAPQRDRRN